MTTHEPQEQYSGPAMIASGDVRIEVAADLRGRFEPIDGLFHWYGRVSGHGLDTIGSGADVTVTTEHGSAAGRLSDVDLWGRPRISGTGRPPF